MTDSIPLFHSHGTSVVPLKKLVILIPIIARPLKNAYFCSSSRKAIILTTVILLVFRGLKFEPDAEIGQKGAFCKGLIAGSNDRYV